MSDYYIDPAGVIWRKGDVMVLRHSYGAPSKRISVPDRNIGHLRRREARDPFGRVKPGCVVYQAVIPGGIIEIDGKEIDRLTREWVDYYTVDAEAINCTSL